MEVQETFLGGIYYLGRDILSCKILQKEIHALCVRGGFMWIEVNSFLEKENCGLCILNGRNSIISSSLSM
jgi:hypothetical protein